MFSAVSGCLSVYQQDDTKTYRNDFHEIWIEDGSQKNDYKAQTGAAGQETHGWKQTNQQRVRGKTGLNTQGVMNKWATGEQEKWCWRTDSEVESKTRQARMNFQHETGNNKMDDDEDDEDKSGWGTHT